MKIIKKQPRINGSNFVFTTNGRVPFTNFDYAKNRIRKLMSKDIPPWRPHDLRRSCASGLQRLGVRLEVTEAALNHVSGSRGGIVGVYQRYDYFEERGDALRAWGRHIETLIGHGIDNVVELKAVGLSQRLAPNGSSYHSLCDVSNNTTASRDRCITVTTVVARSPHRPNRLPSSSSSPTPAGLGQPACIATVVNRA